jgi:hypothetical protein
MTTIERPVAPAPSPFPGGLPRALDGLALLLAGLMVATSIPGLFLPGVYWNNTWSTAAFRATDATTLFVVVPVLVCATLLARKGWLSARLAWLGVLAYNVYNYAFYLFGTAFNDLFLLYAATMALSLVVLVFALPRVLPTVTADRQAPVRIVGAYLVLVGSMFGAVWVAQSLRYVVTDELPTVISDSGIHTSIVFALDLTLVVPWMLIAGVLLWRRTSTGITLAVVLNVLAVLYMTALVVTAIFLTNAGVNGVSWTDPPYLEVGIASLLALVLFVPHVHRVPAKRRSGQ